MAIKLIKAEVLWVLERKINYYLDEEKTSKYKVGAINYYPSLGYIAVLEETDKLSTHLPQWTKCDHPWINEESRCRECGVHAGNIIDYLKTRIKELSNNG